jgi:hypothetical protein
MLSYKGDAEKVLKILNGTDISLTLADKNGTLELTPSITHKYRPIQFYNASDSNATSVLVNTDSEAFSLVAGSNITFRNTTAQGGALTKGTLVIEATDTWRDIQAYAFASNAMTQASIGTTALKFNNDFIWSSNELGICWTEIDANGVVTYL